MTKLDELYEAALKEAARNDALRAERGEPPSKYTAEQRAEALAKLEWSKLQQAETAPKRKASPGGRLSKKFLASHAVPPVTTEEAHARKLFGPVWHGSSEQGREDIAKRGFRIIIGTPRSGETAHGYPYQPYGGPGTPPAPIHHLGYGVYFTTSKSVAKKFNGNSMVGLVTYYLDVPRLETINFGATNTMMKWWTSQGYDGELAKTGLDGWFEATKTLTQRLASKWDAVWFKGKGLYSLLDGDQICVYDTARIYRLDDSAAGGLSLNAKVRRKSDGMTGKIVDKRALEEHHRQFHGGSKFLFKVKWKVGGTDWNVKEQDIEPLA